MEDPMMANLHAMCICTNGILFKKPFLIYQVELLFHYTSEGGYYINHMKYVCYMVHGKLDDQAATVNLLSRSVHH
jgi:hypothetical protein